MSCKCNNRPNIGRGASFDHSGEELTATIHEGCYKLHEYDWLEDKPDNNPTNIFEVRFKNTRRSYYVNVNNLPLKKGDIVAVESSPGHDIGVISLTGDMVARQMSRVGFNPQNGEFRKIYRVAKPYDIEKWQEAIELEHETMIAARQIAADMGLNMKIGDVEYQGDRIKAIFYYISDERVDFRELIKVFADRFHIRIEMKQIGARQEAGRIGGLGACGRELCCASWISNFNSVTTNAARMQEISLNHLKLAGQCSKLKCCLMHEYDTYVDARKGFPRLREPLQAMDGEYHVVKSDVLAGTIAFSSSRDAMANVVTLPVDRVREIMALNRAGKRVEQLQREEDMAKPSEEPTYRSQEDSITRFDKSKRRQGGRQRRGGKDGAPRPQGGQPQQNQQPRAQGDKPREEVKREGGNGNQRRRPQPRADREQQPNNNKPQNREQQVAKPQGERAQGERAQADRPRGDRPRRPRPERKADGGAKPEGKE